MSIYDIIPVEHHGMSEWTLFVFVIAGITAGVLLKLFGIWKANHDAHMETQIKRINAHDRQLNNVAINLTEINADGKYVRQQLKEIKKPLEDMSELTRMVIAKVLDEDKK